MFMTQIFLPPPHLSGIAWDRLLGAFDSDGVVPEGMHVSARESEGGPGFDFGVEPRGR